MRLSASFVFILGFILGFLLWLWLFKPDTILETRIETEIKVDTCYIELRDTVYLTRERIKQEIVRDTVLVNYQPKIRAYRALFPLTYGDVSIQGEVLGEVMTMNANADFKIPKITKAITTKEVKTIIENKKALYLGGRINQRFAPDLTVIYVSDQFLFEYHYDIITNSHGMGISKKVFGW